MPNAHKICRELGIKLHARGDKHPGKLPAKTTWSRQAIIDVAKAGIRLDINTEVRRRSPQTSIARDAIVKAVRSKYVGGVEHDHVYNTLTLLLSSEKTNNQLYGDVILGVSHWALANSVKSEEVPFLSESFGELDIEAIRDMVHHFTIPNRPYQIALLVSEDMENAVKEMRA